MSVMSHYQKRKVIQVVITPESTEYYSRLIALCDDGTIWMKPLSQSTESEWEWIPSVPQRKDPEGNPLS